MNMALDLKRVLEDMALGILGGETPVITEMARQTSKDDGESWSVDPVNFEKPYVKRVEYISTVHKATPPDLAGHARLKHGCDREYENISDQLRELVFIHA